MKTIDSIVNDLGCTISDELLKVHRSYLPVIDQLLSKNVITGLSHITGGGLLENTKRVIPEDLKISIDWDAWEWLPVFQLIYQIGNVPLDDMRRTFNLGIGLVMIIRSSSLDTVLNYLDKANEKHYVIGNISD